MAGGPIPVKDDPFAPKAGEAIDPFTEGDPFAAPPISPAFTDRIKRGDEITGLATAFGKGAAKHFDTSTPLGMSDETIDLWRKHGIFADPATGRPGILPREDEAFVQGIAAAGDIALRSIHAGIGGVGSVAANIAQRLGLPEPERLGREVSGELERRMISGDMAVKVHARLEPTREAAPVRSQPVGTVPLAQDFTTAAENIVALRAPEPPITIGYHGSLEAISVSEMDPAKAKLGRGLFFSDNPELANKFAQGMAHEGDPLMIFGEDNPAKIKTWVTEQVGEREGNRIGKLIDEAQAAAKTEGGELSSETSNLYNKINDELRRITALAEGAPNITSVGINLKGRKVHEVDLGGKFSWQKEAEAIDYADKHGFDAVKFTNTGETGNFYSILNKDLIEPAARPTLQAVEAKLHDLWEKRGIHPAEAAHDAALDPFVHQELTQGTVHPAEKVPLEAWIKAADETLDAPVTDAEVAIAKGAGLPGEPPLILYQGVRHPDVGGLPKGSPQKSEYWTTDLETAKTYAGPQGFVRVARWSDFPEHAHARGINRGTASSFEIGTGGQSGRTVQVPEIGQLDSLASAEAFAELATPSPPAPLRAVGADVVRGPMPSLEAQPPVQRGRLVEAGRQAVSNLQGLGRNVQYMLDPMATGSKEAMALAKDTINSVRRIRWEHAQMDAALTKDEGLVAARRRIGESVEQQHTRMWNAADEESVMRQEIGPEGSNYRAAKEHMGLATLEPEERAFVERLHANAQSAWLNAVDAGMVEGEGLPAYTPRMVLNVAAAAEHVGPQALNELGRNVFTRVGSMKHRKYFMAEETEAAAKELVARRLAERGATPEEIAAAVEKVKIARNIRALPLATAKLQEAAIWHDMIRQIEAIGKATGREVVAEYNPGGWFTIAGNPAFSKWGPVFEKNPVTGTWGARVDDAGRPLMVRKPIYMPPEFKGPMTAILDESASRNKLVQGASTLYGGLMALKGRAMLMILNSPLIHNAVVWGKVVEAVGGKEWLGFGLYSRGNRLVNGPAGGRASELIQRGLNPMGPRGSFQDIHAIMESPDIMSGYHKSWTGRVLGFVPGLFDEAAGVAVEKAIAKAGNFWHNTLLWDRVRDLQFGLADHLSDRIVAKGADRLTADRIAAHFSNIVVGSIPKEAMSNGAAATANMLLFSRSFTLGNIATYKQAAMGLPKPILAQIEKQFGMPAEAALGKEAAAAVTQTAQSLARRKAASMLGLSVTMYYTGNALLQNALNIVMRDSTIDDELKGYARRYHSFMTDVAKNPFELRHLIGRLSPVYENEPDKQDRVHIGYDKDGTAYYGRNPVGKYGEEVIGYPSHPMKMLRQKLSPTVGGLLDILENDKGFGRKIYDEHDTSNWATAKTAFAVAKHLVMKHLPENQITAGVDLLHDEGDRHVNALRFVAPVVGFTVSKGAPGGMARGEQMSAKQDFDARFSVAWPDIRKKIQAGNVDEAIQDMNALRVPEKMQHGLIRNAQNPSGALRGRTLRDFYQYGTPEQIERFEGARERTAPRPAPLPAPPVPPPVSPQSGITIPSDSPFGSPEQIHFTPGGRRG